MGLKEIPTAETVWRSFTLIPVSGTNWVPIYFPGWSIGYELYFYIAVGVALLLYPRSFFTISAITVLTIAVVRVPVPFTHHMRYFQSDWGLEFFFGLMICSGYRAGVRLSHVEGAICLVVSCCLFALNASGNVLPRVLAWGVPSALMVVGALALEGLPLFRNRWFRWGGDASYAIYLFHIPVIEWLRETATKHYVDLNANRTLTIAVTASLAIASGLLVNRYFEAPLLSWLRKRLLPKRGDSRQAARLGNGPQPASASSENASVDLASRGIRLDQGR